MHREDFFIYKNTCPIILNTFFIFNIRMKNKEEILKKWMSLAKKPRKSDKTTVR